MSESPQYFNFPVQILEGMFEDKGKVLHDILCYSLFAHTEKLFLGNNIERFIEAAKYYNVGLQGTEKSCYKRGMELFNSIPDKSPKVGINLPMYWEFRSDTQSQFDIACLTAFLALKSILGKDDYCKTNNALLWSRMDGNSKTVNDKSELSPFTQKYCNDYQTVKIKNELCLNWGLVTYSRFTKGFYISFKMNLAELVLKAEKARKTSKQKEKQQRDRATIQQVLKSIRSD